MSPILLRLRTAIHQYMELAGQGNEYIMIGVGIAVLFILAYLLSR